MADFEEPGDEDVIRKVRKDFAEKGVEVSDHLMNVEMDKAVQEARTLVQNS